MSTAGMARVRLLSFVTAILFTAVAAAAIASAAPSLKTRVLRLQDMPTGFSVKSRHFESLAAAAKRDQRPVSELKKWGYVNGYEADFSRDVSLSTLVRGAIEVDSSVSLYRSRVGVRASFADSARRCNKAPLHKLSLGAKIGDAAILCAATKKSGGYTFRVYAVEWRRGRLKASVLIVGLKGGVAGNQAVSLAKVQDRRMR
jgi:hypothetical protein